MDLGFTIISDEALVLGLSILMGVVLCMALAVSKRRTGLLLNPVTFFFLFAFVHVLFGRYAALLLVSRYSFVGPATLEPFVNQAFLIIATGLTCCLAGYVLIPSRPAGSTSKFLVRISCQEGWERLCARSKVLVLVSIPLIIVGLQGLGGIPLLSDNLRHDRYLMNFTPEHRIDTFLISGLFVIFAGLSTLLTATRSPLLIMGSVVTMVLVWRNRVQAVVLIVVAIVGGLFASEVALGGDASTGSSEWTFVQRIGADVAEVRDLAWTLARHEEPYWGKTFVAGLLPIPAFASDFTQAYHLRTITLDAIRIPLSAGHGGLRITYSGEWFINFGWAGVIIGGFLYGWMCSAFGSLFHRLRLTSALSPVGTYVIASAWVSLSFVVYISASGAGGTLKTYAASLFLLMFRLNHIPEHPNGPRGSTSAFSSQGVAAAR
jgi:hypothetical protein